MQRARSAAAARVGVFDPQPNRRSPPGCLTPTALCSPPVPAWYSSDGGIVPTIRGIPGPYRFFFFSFDRREPRHVHVERDRSVCKLWLEPIRLAWNRGFSPRDVARIRAYILRHQARLVETWNEHWR